MEYYRIAPSTLQKHHNKMKNPPPKKKSKLTKKKKQRVKPYTLLPMSISSPSGKAAAFVHEEKCEGKSSSYDLSIDIPSASAQLRLDQFSVSNESVVEEPITPDEIKTLLSGQMEDESDSAEEAQVVAPVLLPLLGDHHHHHLCLEEGMLCCSHDSSDDDDDDGAAMTVKHKADGHNRMTKFSTLLGTGVGIQYR